MTIGDPSTTLTADLTGDSGSGSSTDAPFNCTIPDGTQMNFDGGAFGTVSPATAGTINGVAVTDFTPTSPGTADDISVVTDAGGETATTQIIISAVTADVAITKTLDTLGPFVSGQSIQYTLVASNNGPNAATNVQVTDTPTNLTITSVSSTNCSAFPCTIPSLANAASETISVAATIDASGAFDNSTTVSADETDPDTSNNTDNTGNGGTAGTSADVAITKTLNTSGPFSPNQSIQYTLVVTNNGPDTANNVVVTDTPSNLTITSVSSTNCSSLPCTIPFLSNGSSETITVMTTISGTGSFDNASSVSADETDPVGSNNSDNTGNGGTIGVSIQQVPGLNWLSLLLLAALMTATLYRRKMV